MPQPGPAAQSEPGHAAQIVVISLEAGNAVAARPQGSTGSWSFLCARAGVVSCFLPASLPGGLHLRSSMPRPAAAWSAFCGASTGWPSPMRLMWSAGMVVALHSTPAQPGRLHVARLPGPGSSGWEWQPLQLAEDALPDVVARTLASMSFTTIKAIPACRALEEPRRPSAVRRCRG